MRNPHTAPPRAHVKDDSVARVLTSARTADSLTAVPTEDPLELIEARRYPDLVELLDDPRQRNDVLAKLAALADQPPQPAYALAAPGDWSWGLLSAAEQREFLLRDARLLLGGGDDGAAQRAALERLRGELGSLYGQLDVALRDGDLDWLLPLAEALYPVLEMSSRFEDMQGRYQALLAAAERLKGSAALRGGERPPAQSPELLELHALLGLASAQASVGEYRAAELEAQRAARLAGELGRTALLASALQVEATALCMRGELAAARPKFTEAIALWRQAGDAHGELMSAGNLAFVEEQLGNRAESRALMEDALLRCNATGERRAAAMFLQNLAALDYTEGNVAQCRARYREALDVLGELGDTRSVSRSLSGLAFAEYHERRFEDARVLFVQALALCRDNSDPQGEASAGIMLGQVALCGSEFSAARSSYEAALGLCRVSGDRQGEARALCGLGLACLQSGEPTGASDSIAQALRIFVECEDAHGMVDATLYGAAALASRGAATDAQLARAGALHHALALEHAFDPVDELVIARLQASLPETSATVSKRAAALSIRAHAELAAATLTVAA